MSNDSNNSLLSRAWHVVIGLLASTIVLWVVVTIVKAIWVWLLIIAVAVVIIVAVVIGVRWWLRRHLW